MPAPARMVKAAQESSIWVGRGYKQGARSIFFCNTQLLRPQRKFATISHKTATKKMTVFKVPRNDNKRNKRNKGHGHCWVF